MELLLKCIITSLKITAINALFWQGMILEKVPAAFINLPQWMKKPTFQCLVCMSSFWGLLFWFIPMPPVIDFIFVICGMLVIISSLLKPLHEQ